MPAAVRATAGLLPLVLPGLFEGVAEEAVAEEFSPLSLSEGTVAQRRPDTEFAEIGIDTTGPRPPPPAGGGFLFNANERMLELLGPGQTDAGNPPDPVVPE